MMIILIYYRHHKYMFVHFFAIIGIFMENKLP